MRPGVNSGGGGTSEPARGGGRGEHRGPRDESRPTDRVGQFHLGRCIERGTLHGDLYLARDLGTGEAALVVKPVVDEGQLLPSTPLEVLEQYPSAALEVSVRASDSPAYRAVVIRTPRSASPASLNEELTAVSDELPKLMSRVLGRADVRDHLLSPPLSRAQRMKGRARRQAVRLRNAVGRRWKDVALAAAVAGFLTLLVHRPEPTPADPPRSAMPAPLPGTPDQPVLTAGIAEAALEIEAPVLLVWGGPDPFARDMPRRPFKAQKKVPCNKTTQEPIHGGCWLRAAKPPPCGDELYEYEGACYAPVQDDRDAGESTQSIAR